MEKKIIFSAALIAITAIIAKAQETQTWTTDLITVPAATEAKLGTGSNSPINFYTAGEKRIEIGTDGLLRPLFPIRFGSNFDSSFFFHYQRPALNVDGGYNPTVMDFGKITVGSNGVIVGDNPNTSGDPQPDPNYLKCTNGTYAPSLIANFNAALSVSHFAPNAGGSNSTGGNILLGHNGSNAFIETQGTTTNPTQISPGALLINTRCKRDVFIFHDSIFQGGTGSVMSVGGNVNVKGVLQLAGNTPAFVIQSINGGSNSAQMYIRAQGIPSNGIIMRHAHGSYAQSAGIKLIEGTDDTRAIMVNRTNSSLANTNDDGTTNFIVYGNGRTVVGNASISANAALTIKVL